MEATPTRLSAASWSDSPPTTAMRCGVLQGHLLSGEPGTGLRNVLLDEIGLQGPLFRVAGGGIPLAAPSESYLRGEDFVSTHPATEAFPFRTQLYWSARELAVGGVATTLTVSLQTDLLDTRPELAVATKVEPTTAVSVQDRSCRIDLAAEATVVLTPHPSDAPEFRAKNSGDELTLHFTPPFLEKGVIRRCRAAAIFLQDSADDSTVAQAIAEFAAMPLPLTT